MPVRTLIPQFSNDFFEKISDSFNTSADINGNEADKKDSDKRIAIIFNSYDARQGMEVVHLNPSAKVVLNKNRGDRSSHRIRTIYKDITPSYVRDGLWLYQYGFEDNTMLDGCYYRQVILSELSLADLIFIARPVSRKWIGTMPTSYIECEDLKTEIFFNGSYQGERDKIALINSLLEKNKLIEDDYHQIWLYEAEVGTQEGFFDYIFEDMRLFDGGYKAAIHCFEEAKRDKPKRDKERKDKAERDKERKDKAERDKAEMD